MTCAWIDCEFNGHRGALISMAIVCADGREWYAATHCDNIDKWVANNVIPVLSTELVSVESMRSSLYCFLRQYDKIHLIADWPADIELFCDLLISGQGERIDTPDLTMEIKRHINSKKSTIPHNALCDARAIRAMDIEYVRV